MLQKIKIIYLDFIISFIILGLGVGIFMYLKGFWRFSYDDIQITDLSLCKTENYDTKYPEEKTNKLPITIESIYVCGYLTTKTPIKLHMYLLKDTQKQAISSNDPNDTFSQGFFSRKFVLPNDDKCGNYRIDIYLFRNVIASKNFQVLSQ